MRISNTFAACNPNNKSTAVNSSFLYYLSASNLIQSDYFGITDVTFFDNPLTAINAFGDLVAVGDTQGNCYVKIQSNLKYIKISSKVQDCCFISTEACAFATMSSLQIFYFMEGKSVEIKTDYIISSISAKGNYIIVGSNLGMLYLYKVSIDGIIKVEEVNAHSDSIKCIRFKDDVLFATCSQDNNVKIWNFYEKISLLQTLNGHSDWVNHLFWEDSRLYSASADKTIRVWEINSNKQKSDAENNYYICSNIFGGSSEILSVFFLEGRIMGQFKTGGIDKLDENEYFLTGHIKEITDIDWKDDLLLTCSLDRTSRMFYKGMEVARPQTHGFALSSAKFLPHDKLRFISAGHETILRMFEATKLFFDCCSFAADHKGEDLDLYLKEESEKEYQKSGYLSELNLTNEILDDNVQEDLSENLLSTNVFIEHKKIYGHFFEIKDIAVGKSYILSCNRSAVKKFAGLFLWNINGEKLDYVESHDLGIQKIAISSDDKKVVTVGRDKNVYFYRIVGDRLLVDKKFEKHERIVFDCGFSSDSLTFATCSRDQKVILYDSQTLEVVAEKEFSEEITSLCFSPTQNILALGSASGSVYILDKNLDILGQLKVLGKKINVLRFNDSGSMIAVGGSDNLLRIIDI